MGFRLIEGYSEDEVEIWDGQILPAPSLLRGESGRFLLTPERDVPVNLIAAAQMGGADRVYRPNGQWIPINEFEELAVLKDDVSGSEPLYHLPEFIWHLPHGLDVFVAQDRSETREEAFYEEDEPAQNVIDAFESAEEHRVTGDSDPFVADEDEEPFDSMFVHLHCHSEYSALDGLATVEEIVSVAKDQGQRAVAVADHGVVASHPELADECEKQGIKPIFGMEAYLVPDRLSREGGNNYYHVTLWAMNDQGLRNLWAISTEGYRDGYYGGHPRIDWDTLTRLNEGILASSGCLRGPLAFEYKNGNLNGALTNSAKMMEIFGDRYYIEIHTNQLADQIKVNKWLISHAKEMGIPPVVAVDSHYAYKRQRDDHQVWISVSVNKDVDDESSLFGGGQDYHMKNEDEVISSLSYLDVDDIVACMQNSVTLADRCDAKILKREGMPIYSHGADAVQQDADKMLDMCMARWDERTAGKKPSQDEYLARFEREARLLIDKGFPGYFLMNADLVQYAKQNGVMVGPGRGSGAASLVAYLLGITEIDPVENDLLFERFMTEGRTALPDFDIDYPSSRKQFMLEYAQTRWGKNHVCAVGTAQRMKNKNAFKDTARAIKSRLPEDHFTDLDHISKIITVAEASTAGLGLSWEDLMDQCEDDLKPYKDKYPELFELAGKFRGRLRTYGKHAAGLVLDPQYDLEGVLPMFLSSDGKTLVTQFDKDVLENLGYVKFDFLNLRNLDTIQLCVDLIKEQLGITVDVTKWREEYNDAEVYKDIADGWTLGMFQLETPLGTRTVKQIKPKSIADISDATTLGRPGPIRSGLDKTFFRRREGKEKIRFADDRLSEVLARSYGTMIYQEDIMAVTIKLADYSDNEADYVRKILGKKKPEEAAKEGIKFVRRAVENGTDEQVAKTLWAQMEEFSRYSFNRGHACAYATLAYWTAWFKHHYPIQYMAACMSTIEQDEIPEYVAETRRLGFRVLPPDINDSKAGFANTETEVRYGFLALKGIAEAATKLIIENQPYTSFEDFVTRSGVDKGKQKILVHIGAFDSLEPNRKYLEQLLEEDDTKAAERCIFFQLQPRNKYNDLPCGFDWDSEPPKLGKTGKPLKNQPKPAAKCSKSCRNWTPRPLPDPDDVTPYTPEEIREIEMDTLGIYLSSSPFDIISSEDNDMLVTANELMAEPNGSYLMAIFIKKVKNHRTKDGKLMHFMSVDTPSGTLDLTVFSDQAVRYRDSLRPGQLALAEVRKNDRGTTLQLMETL